MHDQPTAHTEHEDYEWPTCAAGPTTGPRSHQLWENELDRLVCWPCEERTAARITELPTLFAQLNKTAMLMKGANRVGGGTSGTRTAPIPPRLDVLNLVGPGGLSTKLQAIEDSWRLALGRKIVQRSDGTRLFASWRDNPATAVPEHAEFLRINLRRACEDYESIGQDIDDLRRLHGECKALAEHKPRTGTVKIGLCPVNLDHGTCATQLTAGTRSFKTQCPACNTAWEGEYEWKALVRAQRQALAEASVVAA